MALTEKGRYSEACPKLAESQALDPGIGTLYNLSDCYEHVGRTAAAWSGFTEAASLANAAGQADRAGEARRRAAALEPKLSKLQIVVPPTAAVAGLEVRRDDAVLLPADWGKDAPVDPGKHVVSASAPGRPPWTKEVMVDKEGKVVLVEVPALAAGSSPPPDGDKPGSTSRGRSAVPAIVLGGVALVGVGAGVGLLVASSSKQSDTDTLRDAILKSSGEQGPSSCHSSLSGGRQASCDELMSAAKSVPVLRGAAIGAFVAGGLAAAGALGYLFWPSGAKTEAGFNVRVMPAAGSAFVGAAAAGSF